MPKTTKNPELMTNGKAYISQLAANDRYLEKKNLVMVGFRVTADTRDKIENYVKQQAEHENDTISALTAEEQQTYVRKYTTKKGRPSVNTLLLRLLEQEMGEDLAHYQ